ncbi:polyprotein [Hirsutella rhossiliensis]|uniref:Polyprotein n=1 Tax=Hirsutella rhossiliensis TaxID=111463 RepID=A0A9P8N8F3_9HYPO|nr:polyprotein [Hirsutella rhossiliensis]KAH0968880.1 polyprotein [Hirsutella rhossiliensis]
MMILAQLGFVIVLANEEQSPADFTIRGNVLHWSSTKSKRVTRSVLASEIYGMVQGFDMAIVIATTLQAIVKQLDLPPTPLIVCTDSYSLYECLVKLGTTKEKRLMIDIMALRQSYEQREMAEIRWINGDDNPADAMTKQHPTVLWNG